MLRKWFKILKGIIVLQFKVRNKIYTNNSAFFFKDVIVHPYSGLISDHKVKIFPESAFGRHKIPTLYSFFRNSSRNQELQHATIIEHGPWDNYYHWYIDSLPRLWSLHESRDKLPAHLDLLLSKTLNQEEFAILRALLPETVSIRFVDRDSHFRVCHFLFLPFLSADCSGSLPPAYLEFYLQKTSALFFLQDGDKLKLYITRKHASKRKFINEAAVIQEMEARGFRAVALENLSIREQAQLFYNAELVIAQHGAGLTNLLYSRFAKVVEIFSSPNQHLNHYRGLCQAKQLDYLPIYLNGKEKNEDVYLDIRLIDEALKTITS